MSFRSSRQSIGTTGVLLGEEGRRKCNLGESLRTTVLVLCTLHTHIPTRVQVFGHDVFPVSVVIRHG